MLIPHPVLKTPVGTPTSSAFVQRTHVGVELARSRATRPPERAQQAAPPHGGYVRQSALFALCLLAICLCGTVRAEAPIWWTNRNVLCATPVTNDYVAVNAGQLKWIASNACAELEQYLPGGAGSGAWSIVNSFAVSNNYLAINQGQLKYVATPFYDRLIAAGYPTSYPWTTNTAADDINYAAVNLGQLKNVFGFDPRRDTDSDGLADWVETGSGTYVNTANTGSSPTDSDADNDGLLDGAEVSGRTDPNNSDTTKPVVVVWAPASGIINFIP